MLDSHALVVGQDGADTDALKVRVMGLDLAQEVVEVFCLVMRVIRRRGRITRAVYSPWLFGWPRMHARYSGKPMAAATTCTASWPTVWYMYESISSA